MEQHGALYRVDVSCLEQMQLSFSLGAEVHRSYRISRSFGENIRHSAGCPRVFFKSVVCDRLFVGRLNSNRIDFIHVILQLRYYLLAITSCIQTAQSAHWPQTAQSDQWYIKPLELLNHIKTAQYVEWHRNAHIFNHLKSFDTSSLNLWWIASRAEDGAILYSSFMHVNSLHWLPVLSRINFKNCHNHIQIITFTIPRLPCFHAPPLYTN